MTDFYRRSAYDLRREMYLGLGLGRRSLAVIRPEPGSLPAPLERVANAMYDAKTNDEAKAAASEFITLSEEWVDSPERPAS